MRQEASSEKEGFSQGFTLLEVMIAMTILALMSVLIYASTSQTITSKEETETLDSTNHSVSLALDKMAADLQMAFLLSGSTFLGAEGKQKTVFIGKADRLDFASLSHVRYFKEAKEADTCEVGYWVEPSRDDPEIRVLKRREARLIDDKPEEGGMTDDLVEGVQDFHLEYYDARKKEWVKEWNSSQLEFSDRLPRAVKIEVKVNAPDQEEPLAFSTIAEIKLNAPINF